ncbi:sensory histidine kinase CreC [Streptomyces sp. ADI96-15]|uniref:sensor histidine kinase n=1 Tax=Streptomyces TaxID=1883 RepID=UPI000687D82F|nr:MULTISPECIES: sensor histidine kinase [Streptomyces]MBP3077967.1 histidine kinase [Streptomyces sp. 604F]QHV86908.1 ATP-binding protein [Streptomyces sp. 604F]RPK57132.1 sensory histidine kinase CreC [Streptomyces sp. ADI96-15]RWZ72749.1 ATP-binding protein [Streptomyces albidoflavus]WSB22017.1 ATP-binding protein [Streptomyces albidoflavus]
MTATTPLTRSGTERLPLRPAVRALLVSVLVTGVLGTAFVLSAPPSVRTPLAWCTAAGALLLCVAAVTVARYVQVAEALRERLGSLGEEVARGDQERVRLTGENTRLAEERRRALAERDAALASFANAAGRMQALSTGMLADLRAMQERHSDEDVLADLFHLDHRTAQAGRLADSVAVLSGARSGRRWARPIVMESILRGALGRISGYQRVRTHAASDVHVAGHAAEGVMHVLAELLDNATTFSPPNAEVHVYAEEVPAGLIVSVEDAGLVMSEVQLRRAESAVSGTTDLASLSGTRMGLAVVGRLARKHGLKVSFRPSARGGTGVLVLLPQELLSRPSHPAGPGATATVASPEAREHPFAGLPAAPATAPVPAPAAEAETAALPATPATKEAATTPATPSAGDPDPYDSGAFRTVPYDPAAYGSDREDGPGAHTRPAADAESGETPDGHARTPLPSRREARTGRTPGARPRTESPSSATGTTPGATGSGPAGLPKRRRGQTLAAAHPEGAPASPGAAPDPVDARLRAARFSSFRNAVRPTEPTPEGNESP